MNKQKQIVLLIDSLVKAKSTKDNSMGLKQVLKVASEELKRFKSEKFVSNGVHSTLFRNTSKKIKNFKVILNSHLDVVPGLDSQYKAIIKGDKLFGRGASDMKGGAAVQILLFKELADKLDYPLGLQLVTDEEIGGHNGAKYQVEKGIRADFVITGEPSNLEIVNKTKGVFWVKIIANGKSAHGASLWKGKNAILTLNNALTKIFNKYPVPKKAIWKTTVNLGSIGTTNQTFNKVPDQAEAWLDIRYIPEEEKAIESKINKLLPENIKIEKILKEPPQLTDKSNNYIKLLKRITETTTNKKVPITFRHGANDVRHFTNVGVPGVEFGPIGDGIHTESEWVSIKSLVEYYESLKNFLLSLNKNTKGGEKYGS